jgi:hypothetical protein
MKEHLKKIIKKEVDDILESAGKQDDIEKYSEKTAKLIVDFTSSYINNNKEKLHDGYEWEFGRKEIINTDYFKENILIGAVKLNVNYIHSEENKISGSFKKAQLLDDGYYLVFLEINIKINNDIKQYLNQIEYWVSHELHHAFRYIKTINKESKEKFLNRAKNYINEEIKQFIKSYPELKEFMNMIYLSLSSEVEARQQETASQLKNVKTNSPTETIKYLQQFQPINDARKMLNYNPEKILNINPNVLDKFIGIFNKNLKDVGLENKTKKNPQAFFSYWEIIINKKGNQLLRKILRMVSDKHLLKEGLYFLNIEESLLEKYLAMMIINLR